MTEITPDTIRSAVVDSVEVEDGYIMCIVLRLPDGRLVDVVAEKSNTDILEAPWLELL